ncbi:MAG: histidine kinase [Flavobacteriales bacterium]|nr:histidine kinase [Flavobacteriales bacterium]
MASGPRVSLFLPGGQFRMGTVLLLHVGFGLLLGLGTNVIWWMRTGDAAPMVSVYSFLFASYHAITAFTMHMAVLRAGRERGKHLFRIATGLFACMLLFIVVRWIGDQWLMPSIGEKANYPAQVTFLSFALDNLLYALLPIGFATLMYLVEQQLVQHQQRTELTYRERLSELDMLRARMAPHFLYNTLNNLYALSQRSGTDLGPPLMDLADLMRYISKHQEEFVAIGTELEQVDRFIALQALRYEHPLNIRIDVDDELRNIRIPSMVLLPLMENAFKHGDPCDRTIPVELRISMAQGRIRITCTNKVGAHTGDGSIPTGNHNLQRRLELLFGEGATVSFRNTEDHRFVAELSFPPST